ncbi:MAG: hypothetical protein F4X92_03050 [Gammaproteobacteria bacterium]|nr:hypothetical protein [Gammaproteobacteria bacterium]
MTRLKSYTGKCYITSTKLPSTKGRYDRDTIKMIRNRRQMLSPSVYSGGRVTIRWTADYTLPDVELAGGAEAI